MVHYTYLAALTAMMLVVSSPSHAQKTAAGSLPLLQPGSAQGPLAQLTPIGGGVTYNNRSINAQQVIPPGGCLILTVTASDGVCLQDASFKVNNNSVATGAQLLQAGLGNATSIANSAANATACANADAPVVSVYEESGCVLAEALQATTGLAGSNVGNSFVCTPGPDTTSFNNVYPREVCTEANKRAQQALQSGDAVATSGDPCTASRATYIIENPCPTQNTTVNGTARFFNAKDTVLAPAPAPDALLAPGLAPGADGPGSPGVVGAEGLGDEPSSDSEAAGSPDTFGDADSPASAEAASTSGAPCVQSPLGMVATSACAVLCLIAAV